MVAFVTVYTRIRCGSFGQRIIVCIHRYEYSQVDQHKEGKRNKTVEESRVNQSKAKQHRAKQIKQIYIKSRERFTTRKMEKHKKEGGRKKVKKISSLAGTETRFATCTLLLVPLAKAAPTFQTASKLQPHPHGQFLTIIL